MTRCGYCNDLTIARLVQLAQVEQASYGYLPSHPDATFPHHTSIDALEASARHGCGMCEFFVSTLKGYNEQDARQDYPTKWKGNACDPAESLFAVAKRLPESNIQICISSGRDFGEVLDGAPLLETIIMQVGRFIAPSYSPGLQDVWFPKLGFNLSAPRSQSPIMMAGFRIGRYETHHDLGAESNFALARDWLNECKYSHMNCLATTCPVTKSCDRRRLGEYSCKAVHVKRNEGRVRCAQSLLGRTHNTGAHKDHA